MRTLRRTLLAAAAVAILAGPAMAYFESDNGRRVDGSGGFGRPDLSSDRDHPDHRLDYMGHRLNKLQDRMRQHRRQIDRLQRQLPGQDIGYSRGHRNGDMVGRHNRGRAPWE